MTAIDDLAVNRQHTAQGNERKLQLLDAARAMISEHGFAKTRISDICAAAGVAKGLFYWYFPTKQALFDELVRAARKQLQRAQAEAMDPTADPLTRLRQHAEATLRFMVQERGYLALLDAERAEHAETFREGSELYTADVMALIEEAQSAGQISPGNVRLHAIGAAGAMFAFSNAILSGRFALETDEVAEFAGVWLARAYAGPGPAADGPTPSSAINASTTAGSN